MALQGERGEGILPLSGAAGAVRGESYGRSQVISEAEGGSTYPGGRYWWLKGLVGSAALVAVLLGAFFLAPVVQLRYHAWRYRTERDHDGSSLKWVAEYAVRRRMERTAIEQLLGKDGGDRPDYLTYSLKPTPFSSAPLIGYFILLKDGRASEVQPWPGAGIPLR